MNNSKKIAYCGVFSALASVFLVVGNISGFGFTAGFIASICVVSNSIAYPKGIVRTLISFVVSTTVACLITSVNLQILPYALLFAPLCVTKLWVDDTQIAPFVKWLIKATIFEICFVAYLLIYRYLFFDAWSMVFTSPWLIVAVVVAGQVAFVVYQFAFNVIFKWLKNIISKIIR